MLLLTKDKCPDCLTISELFTKNEVVYKKYQMRTFPILINDNEIVGEGLGSIVRYYDDVLNEF